jgi:hypothetical protein
VHEQVLIARKSLRVSGLNFPAGSILPDDLPPKTIRAFVDSKLAHWEKKTDRFYPSPTPLPEADKPVPQVRAQIVEDSDCVESFLMTEQAVLRLCDNHAGRASDVLMGDERVRELYKRATREACLRAAKAFKKPSVDPVIAWAWIKGARKAA